MPETLLRKLKAGAVAFTLARLFRNSSSVLVRDVRREMREARQAKGAPRMIDAVLNTWGWSNNMLAPMAGGKLWTDEMKIVQPTAPRLQTR
jgi:hypothetical protein